jgi:predicted dehydrogenase
VEFSGVVEPFLNSETKLELEQRGVPVFRDLSSAYETLGQVDLTCIVTPLPLHLEHIKTALKYGSHVLCEKPAAPVLDQLEPMIELEKHSGKCLAIGFQWSFAPAMLRCKEDILSGLFGAPVSAKALVLCPARNLISDAARAGEANAPLKTARRLTTASLQTLQPITCTTSILCSEVA